MRLFLGKDAGAVIRDKLQFSGDDTKADSLVNSYLTAHSGWTAQEVDQETYDAALVVVDQIPGRASAITLLNTDTSPDSKFIRAVLLVILDEINVIRALL